MIGINFLNYMDRWVASSAATPIEHEFHLTDAQFGLVGTAFLLVYAVAALPFGYWGDRGVRKNVIAVGVTIWSLATLFTGFARSYFHLFLSRAIVGVGEASYYPAGTSLLSDFFPKEQRARVMAIWNGGSTIGIAVVLRVARTSPRNSVGGPPFTSPRSPACFSRCSPSPSGSRLEAVRKKKVRPYTRPTKSTSESSSTSFASPPFARPSWPRPSFSSCSPPTPSGCPAFSSATSG